MVSRFIIIEPKDDRREPGTIPSDYLFAGLVKICPDKF
jgi:hypothetical protein